MASWLRRLLLVCAWISTANGAWKRRSKPHILFLMVDEMDGRLLDAESPQVKLPLKHLTALAKRGAQFANTYSSSPLCVPARASMLTGRSVSQIRVWDNFLGIARVNGSRTNVDQRCVDAFSLEDCRTFAAKQNTTGTFIDVLRDHGYNITMWGKVHAGAGLDQLGNYDVDAFKGVSQVGQAARAWTRATGVVRKSQNPTKWLHRPTDLRAPAPGHHDYDTAEMCSQLLQAGLFRSTTPRFLYCSFTIPHPPYQTNSTYFFAVPPLGDLAVPKYVSEKEMHPADVYAAKAKGTWGLDEVRPALIENFRRIYFAMCVETDKLLGQILSALRKSGSDKDAYVVMLSDHGDHALENRQWQKSSMLEGSVRVPFILAGPGVRPRRIHQVASLHDIYPTILDIAGIPPREKHLIGESLLPAAQGHGRKKFHAVAEYHDSYSRTGMYMVRQGDLKYIYHAPLLSGEQWPPQLFNLSVDPWERANIAKDHPKMVQHLQGILRSEIDINAADAAKKAYDKDMFLKYVYSKKSGPAGCFAAMELAHPGFDAYDAHTVEQWLGQRCCQVKPGRRQRGAKYHTLECPNGESPSAASEAGDTV